VAIVAEALSLASRYGLSAASVPDILKGGLADSTILQNQGKRMAAPKLEKSGSAGILVKDLDIAGSMASVAGQALPVGSLVGQLYRMQVSMGYDALGMIGIAQLYRDSNPQ
jgi:2-hydroxy-3-oxopropionate reductase